MGTLVFYEGTQPLQVRPPCLYFEPLLYLWPLSLLTPESNDHKEEALLYILKKLKVWKIHLKLFSALGHMIVL